MDSKTAFFSCSSPAIARFSSLIDRRLVSPKDEKCSTCAKVSNMEVGGANNGEQRGFVESSKCAVRRASSLTGQSACQAPGAGENGVTAFVPGDAANCCCN